MLLISFVRTKPEYYRFDSDRRHSVTYSRRLTSHFSEFQSLKNQTLMNGQKFMNKSSVLAHFLIV